jgi:multidrug efflux pump subunit AcrA (membrane-fusion protein)
MRGAKFRAGFYAEASSGVSLASRRGLFTGIGAVSKIDERIEALEAKLRQLKVQHQRKEARARTAAAKRARGEELRRKILAGAVLLAKVERGEFEESTLKAWMSVALSRPEDRQLFGLEVSQEG